MPRDAWLPFTLGPTKQPDPRFDEAVRLLTDEDGDPNAAIAILESLAATGHVDAQLLLGRVLVGFAPHAPEAEEGVRWLRTAAESGAWDAYYLLGLCAYRGRGMKQDYEEARRYHAIAANHDVANAQFELSLLYDLGHGGPVDTALAEEWETRAADAGHPRACFNRASRLARRDPPDFAGALAWYERAADGGNAEAAARVCRMLLGGEGHARDEDAAHRWFLRAQELGYDWKTP